MCLSLSSDYEASAYMTLAYNMIILLIFASVIETFFLFYKIMQTFWV